MEQIEGDKKEDFFCLDLGSTTTEGEPIEVQIHPLPEANLIAASDLLDCTSEASASLTFEIMPPDSGPWEIQYTLDGGTAITQLIDSSPFVLAIAEAGVYELLSVKTQSGCTGNIGLQDKQSINIKDSPILLSVNVPAPICNDGVSQQIDLQTAVQFSIDLEGTIITGNAEEIGNISWYEQNPINLAITELEDCLLYTSPSPRDLSTSRMPSSA